RLDSLPAFQRLLDNHYGWMAAVAILAILPPMLLLGASFPVAARIVVSGSGNTGRDLGVLYAGNTAGAILGAWAAGFFLIPTLGTQRAIELLAAVNTILGVALAVVSGRGRALVTAAALGLPLVAAGLTALLPSDTYTRRV